jgi:uncharacterized protein YndB with AHSA1/START domain
MTDTLHIQLMLNASADRIFRALTEQLPDWFAEFADVSLADKRYDFWGRYTPEAPGREAGRHPLRDMQRKHQLHFDWQLRTEATTVLLDLIERDDQTAVVVQHSGMTPSQDIGAYTIEDFWFLSLENLRRRLDSKPPVRCDFSKPMLGDIQHTVAIDGTPQAVFETLIKPEQLNRWIASNAVVEPRVGGRYDFGWGAHGPLKILEIVPDKKLSYLWPEGDVETIVTWTLEESGGKTHLTLVHSGFAPDQPTGGLNAGWLNFVSWVRSIVEYGANWKSPVKRLASEFIPFYAGSIGQRQVELVEVDPPGKVQPAAVAQAAPLGTHVEIGMSVHDVGASATFYQALGFRQLSQTALTDGGVIIRFIAGGKTGLSLLYYGSDIPALRRENPHLIGQYSTGSLTVETPYGLPLTLNLANSEVPPLSGTPMTRQPLSRCGKFGEFALPVHDFSAAAAFWERLGFTRLHAETTPYPWGIFSDGLIILGLHQTTDFATPTITYFAGNMAERIAAFQREGLTITSVPPVIDGAVSNAALTTPDGQRVFLFQGEI